MQPTGKKTGTQADRTFHRKVRPANISPRTKTDSMGRIAPGLTQTDCRRRPADARRSSLWRERVFELVAVLPVHDVQLEDTGDAGERACA